MFIYINDVPINVFAIKKVSDILTIDGSIYEVALKMLCDSYGRDVSVAEATSNYFLATEVKTRGYKHPKPFTKILDHINEMNLAIEGKEIYREFCGNYRFAYTDEIRWKVLPDTYFFAVTFDGEMCGLSYLDDILPSEIFTGKSSKSVCLYSEIYANMKDAIAARDKLVVEIDRLKALSPIIKI